MTHNDRILGLYLMYHVQIRVQTTAETTSLFIFKRVKEGRERSWHLRESRPGSLLRDDGVAAYVLRTSTRLMTAESPTVCWIDYIRFAAELSMFMRVWVHIFTSEGAQ